MLTILLTNDDGFDSKGLRALKPELCQLGRVVVVAPDRERSAASHSLTLHEPLRLTVIGTDHYALSGTPADCVLFAIRRLLSQPPDLVVSGMNLGANLGDDVIYSGTVAGAREGSLHGIPSFAVSLVAGRTLEEFGSAAKLTRELVSRLYPAFTPPGVCLNVNLPEKETESFRFTRQSSRQFAGLIEKRVDDRDRSYFWIGDGRSQGEWEPGTDSRAVQDGVISVTPLRRDQTDHEMFQSLHQAGGKLQVDRKTG